MNRWLISIILALVVILASAIISRSLWVKPSATNVTLLRASNWGSPLVDTDFMRVEREIWGEFERRNPGVKLQIEQIPGEGQYRPKLIMQCVAGTPPDVASIDMASGADFMNNGLLLDLRPFIENDPDFKTSDYFQNLWKTATHDGHIYAVPLDFTPMVMFYNKKLFDEAGVPYPCDGWTWDDFRDTCRKLTVWPKGAVRPSQWGFYFENEMPRWVPWLWSNDGDVLSPDGKTAKGYMNGPKSIEAIQFLADLILQDHTGSHPRDRAALGQDFFVRGKAAMDLRGHWMMIDFRSAGLDVGATTIPTNIGKPNTVVYFTGLSIMKQSKHPDLAWKYVKYATSEAVQVKRVASGLAISGNRLAAAHYAGNPVEDAFLKALDIGRSPWGASVENFAVCQDFGKEALDNILYGGIPVRKALNDAAGLMDAVLHTSTELN